MTEWWEVGYIGGPGVQVDGFPRPLYPPDAAEHGKKPSVDGPDVLAYKRALCHAGRWGEWDPNRWDDAYSNGFAHGTGPNVKDTGIAGFQRQQKIDDTGWVGQKTFNNMRYARISNPAAPHYGEPIIDSVCVQLINEAWALFGGSEPTPGKVRDAALERAQGELGVKESPAGSNVVKYSEWYGMVGPWCAMFCTWAFELGADDVRTDSPSFARGSRYAYVPYIVADARAGKYGLQTTDDPIPGDLVCYDWSGDGEYDHVGVFEKWLGHGDFQAIEGNTSTSDNSNGGQVMRRTRDRSGQATVFVRVQEP